MIGRFSVTADAGRLLAVRLLWSDFTRIDGYVYLNRADFPPSDADRTYVRPLLPSLLDAFAAPRFSPDGRCLGLAGDGAFELKTGFFGLGKHYYIPPSAP
jgi:hypothetical protein